MAGFVCWEVEVWKNRRDMWKIRRFPLTRKGKKQMLRNVHIATHHEEFKGVISVRREGS